MANRTSFWRNGNSHLLVRCFLINTTQLKSLTAIPIEQPHLAVFQSPPHEQFIFGRIFKFSHPNPPDGRCGPALIELASGLTILFVLTVSRLPDAVRRRSTLQRFSSEPSCSGISQTIRIICLIIIKNRL